MTFWQAVEMFSLQSTGARSSAEDGVFALREFAADPVDVERERDRVLLPD